MHAAVLASGSAGNCVYIEGGGTSVLVDCGLSVPALKRRLAEIGRDLSSIAAVFVTHDHGDHVGSSVALARKQGIPLYATAGTISVLRRLPEGLARTVRAEELVEIDGFSVRPFSVPHDGIESVAFRVTERASGRSMAVVTDLGFVTRRIVDQLSGVHFLVIEHNHDERMLLEGPYPASLKARVRGPAGHLSNQQGATLVNQLLHPGLKRVVLAHLSETNNTPEVARRTFERVNRNAPGSLDVVVAEQARAGEAFDI